MSGYAIVHDYKTGDDFNGVDYEEIRIDGVTRIEVSGSRPHLESIVIFTESGEKKTYPNGNLVESEVGEQ